MSQQKKPGHWSPTWVTAVVALVAVIVVQAERAHLMTWWRWWAFPFLGVLLAASAVLVTITQAGLLRTHVVRVVACLAVTSWITWATLAGWTIPVLVSLLGGSIMLAALLHASRTPDVVVTRVADLGAGTDRRPRKIREYEALLRRLTKAAVTVTKVDPWQNAGDGERIHVDLPAEGNVTAQHIADVCQRMGVAMRLPLGCTVRVLDGEHQGAVVLDVMRRDCLADAVTLTEDYSPASINDSFQVMTTPSGESLDVCLRSHSMVIGGAPESGKTTLLHRIILFLARCTDAVIWVMDTNGGGVATPFITPYAMGRTKRPIIDWVAADEEEAAVMGALAIAIAKDRKTAPEAVRRKRRNDTMVLPVDEKLPALLVLNDEGGEMRQAVSLIGQLADQSISRITQIGRAEAVRTIKSVLRGTSDLLDKGMRVNAPLRLCLRMEEDAEYGHVLASEPPRVKLIHTGSGYLRRSNDPRPIFGRTVNVAWSQVERAAVACENLRPELDERAVRVAARLRVRDVLGGREPSPEVMASPVMQDVEAGRAYTGRWERFASRLAAIRGEELPDEEPEPGPAPAAPMFGPAVSALLASAGQLPAAVRTEPASVDLSDPASVDRAAEELLSGLDWEQESAAGGTAAGVKPMTLREHVAAILRDAHPDSLTAGQIRERLDDGRRAEGKDEVNRTYLQGLLKVMVEAREIIRDTGRYSITGPWRNG